MDFQHLGRAADSQSGLRGSSDDRAGLGNTRALRRAWPLGSRSVVVLLASAASLVGAGTLVDAPLAGARTRPPTTSQHPAATDTATRAITYTVKPGDTLSGIAAWFKLHGYGGLFAANRSVIGSDPNLIRPGERITIRDGVMSMRSASAAGRRGARSAGARSSSSGQRTRSPASGRARHSEDGTPVPRARARARAVLPPGPDSPGLARGARTSRDSIHHLSAWAVAGWSLYMLSALLSAVMALATLGWMLHAWRTPASLRRTRFQGDPGPPHLSFSLIVPARHEAAVLGHTLARLARLDFPRFEVLVVVGHDDPDTHAVAAEAAGMAPDRVRVIVDHSWPKNKPKALNTALHECRYDVVGVFDAEDEVHPRLLRAIDRQFTETGAHVVQGGVQLMNFRSSWFALCNVLEYFFWFSSRLHFHADRQFIPLGGNTVFVGTKLLRAVGGWDPECLAEDCELGVRLSSLGARTVVAYDPQLVTKEETPETISALVKQRTRWSQGFLQVMRKGEWRRLPARQRWLALLTLSTPIVQALTIMLIPLAFVTALVLEAPVLVVLVLFVPLLPTLMILSVETVGFGQFCRLYGERPRVIDYLRLWVGFWPYQVVLGYAALRATWRQLSGRHDWEKTAHVGAHLHTSTPEREKVQA